MGAHVVEFARQYRAALLDYLLGSGAPGLERAYSLGRRAIEAGMSLLQVIRMHQDAANTVLKATNLGDSRMRQLQTSQDFLLEALAAFEMTHRGYLDLISAERDRLARQ
jgi:hypothetical protein